MYGRRYVEADPRFIFEKMNSTEGLKLIKLPLWFSPEIKKGEKERKREREREKRPNKWQRKDSCLWPMLL